MQKTKQDYHIFDELVQYTNKNPLNFKELGKIYDINKLELQKFTTYELKNKKNELQQKYWKYIPQITKIWMENEYRIYIWFLFAYKQYKNKQLENFTDEDWKIIGKAFRKQPYVCEYFYLCTKKQKTLPWLTHEDKLIQAMMQTDLNKKWTDIGLELFRVTEGKSFKKPKSIRERWLSHLNPQIKRTDWSFEEEMYLIDKISEIGKKWSKISKLMGNRSQHTVKNRYNKLIQQWGRKFQNSTGQTKYSEQEIFYLMCCEFRKKSQIKVNKKQLLRSQTPTQQQTILNSQQAKIQYDLMNELAKISVPQIFHPIVIVYSGL